MAADSDEGEPALLSWRGRDLLGVLGIILSLAALAGCARFHPQPLSAESVADQFQGRALEEPGLRAFLETNLQSTLPEWPLPVWDFRSLFLAACYYNPELEVARLRWQVARAGQVTAGERPNPTVSVAPGYDTTTHVPSPWLVSATLDVPLETAGKRGYRMDEAWHLAEAARLRIASELWQLRGRVRQSLVELEAAEQIAALLEQQQALHADNVRLLEEQRAIGALSAFELTQARLAAQNSQLALRDAERRRAEAQAALAAAVGLPASVLVQVKLSYAGLEGAPGDIAASEARKRALLHRSDILAALATYAASQSTLQLEIAKQYPDVHLNPGYEFDQGDNKWSLGLSVTLPVLNRNEGPIAEAAARRAEQAASFLALQARVLAEIDRAHAVWQVALAKQADADRLLARVQAQEKSAQAMLELGELSRADLVSLRLQLASSSLAGVEAHAEMQRAFGQLEEALQSAVDFPLEFEASARSPIAP